MAGVFFRIGVGCALIVLGRWAYRNPRKVAPATFFADPDSPILVWPTRAFAILLVLGGSYLILTLVAGHVLKGLTAVFVALGLSIFATWDIIPHVPRAARPQGAPERAGGTLTAEGKRFVWLMLAAAATVTVATVIEVLVHANLPLAVSTEVIALAVIVLVLLRSRAASSKRPRGEL